MYFGCRYCGLPSHCKVLSCTTATSFYCSLRYHQGLVVPKGEATKNASLPTLKRLYNKYRECAPPEGIEWTSQDEEELERLLSQEISSLQQTTIFKHALEANNEILKKKMLSHPRNCRKEVLASAFRSPEVRKSELDELSTLLSTIIAERTDIDDADVADADADTGAPDAVDSDAAAPSAAALDATDADGGDDAADADGGDDAADAVGGDDSVVNDNNSDSSSSAPSSIFRSPEDGAAATAKGATSPRAAGEEKYDGDSSISSSSSSLSSIPLSTVARIMTSATSNSTCSSSDRPPVSVAVEQGGGEVRYTDPTEQHDTSVAAEGGHATSTWVNPKKDAQLDPKTKMYKRPTGRAPKGCTWDEIKGKWRRLT
jgi:hypothetical protein